MNETTALSLAPEAPPAEGGRLTRISGAERRLEELTRAEKAAIVLAALGPQHSAGILRALGEVNIRRFARIVARIGLVPAPVIDAVVAEFLIEIGGAQDVSGGLSAARKLLEGVVDKETYDRIMEEVQGMTATTIWDRLGKAPVGPLANFLASEHPQVGAVVLARLKPDRSARVLERLPATSAQSIVLRMKNAPRIEPGVLEVVKSVLEEEFLSVIQREQASRKPAELLASLMNHVSGAARDQFLKDLEADEPEFAAEVQRVMFTFADITARLNPRDVTAITREVEEETLMTALKTGMETAPQVVEFILGNLSKRLAERMTEDLEAMMAPPLKEGEAAQAEIIKAIQAMAQKGEIKLLQIEAGDDD
jgi:flagellar motor switch protein FliG